MDGAKFSEILEENLQKSRDCGKSLPSSSSIIPNIEPDLKMEWFKSELIHVLEPPPTKDPDQNPIEILGQNLKNQCSHAYTSSNLTDLKLFLRGLQFSMKYPEDVRLILSEDLFTFLQSCCGITSF